MSAQKRKAQLKKFVEECAIQRKSVDRTMAEVITAKLCLSAAIGLSAEDVITRIEKTLGDYREILIMEIEEKCGSGRSGEK
ncbi:MAG: hypothetical protein GXX84_12540 [Acidobacteria bacterium]|mgnify:CR=1 FL=1|nr:hypothetical protein [Acidobacteriota bacterium]